MPMRSVKKGVSPLSIPVSEEEIPVSAAVKRKAGIKFPNKPIPRNFNQSVFSFTFTYLNAKGIINRNAMNILNPATCEEVNTSSPRFIRMNELPHTRDRRMRIDQLRNLEFIEGKGKELNCLPTRREEDVIKFFEKKDSLQGDNTLRIEFVFVLQHYFGLVKEIIFDCFYSVSTDVVLISGFG